MPDDDARAVWSAAYINDLPDSAFLYIEPGGTKDEEGKTVPRSLRHFPIRDASGALDLPHLRNALARIPQSKLPQDVKDRLTAKARRLLEEATRAVVVDDFELRSSDDWDDAELRIDGADDGPVTLDGYVAVFERPSVTLSALDLADPDSRRQLAKWGRTFREVIHPGAFAKTLAEAPDVTLHVQHNLLTLPLARTKAGTMTLTEDGRGLRVVATLPDNEWGRPVRDAVRRGDITGMSFRMRGVVERWDYESSPDYTGPVRHLHEIRLRREVSLVTTPAYPETSAVVRHLAAEADIEPDALQEAFEVLRSPDARLTVEQRDLLMRAINARVEEPYISPKLARMQERLAAAFGTS